MVFARCCLIFVSLGIADAAALLATGDQTSQSVTLTNGPAAGQLKVCSSRTGTFEGTTWSVTSNNHVIALMNFVAADIAKVQSTFDPGSADTDLPRVEGMEGSCEGSGACTLTKTLAAGSTINAGSEPLCFLVACFDMKAGDGGGAGDTCSVTYSVTFGTGVSGLIGGGASMVLSLPLAALFASLRI